MKRISTRTMLLAAATLGAAPYAWGGQAPAAASDPDIPISHQDRVYSAEQYSSTVSVTDPVDNKLVGTIRLGDPLPGFGDRQRLPCDRQRLRNLGCSGGGTPIRLKCHYGQSQAIQGECYATPSS
jgi:hypothetical protein